MTNFVLGIVFAIVVLVAFLVRQIRQNPLALRVALDRTIDTLTPPNPAKLNLAISKPFHVKDGRVLTNGTPVVYRDQTDGTLHPGTIGGYHHEWGSVSLYSVEGRWVRDTDIWEPVEIPAKMRAEVPSLAMHYYEAA